MVPTKHCVTFMFFWFELKTQKLGVCRAYQEMETVSSSRPFIIYSLWFILAVSVSIKL